MILLLQFLLRLAFGLAVGMALTSPRQVTSGYYRNHLYVTLGLTLLAALVSRAVAFTVFWPAMLAAGISYVGAIFWLYEKPRAGVICLWLVAGLVLLAAWLAFPDYSPESRLPELVAGEKLVVAQGASSSPNLPGHPNLQGHIDHGGFSQVLYGMVPVTSGLLLGFTMAAMLLGHWYLNSPTMELEPLRRLILAMAGALFLHGGVSAVGLWANIDIGQEITTQWVLSLLLRWLFGLVGVGLLVWMAWQTLKIPNTQSATGILYVAVIGTFVGETMSLLLSSRSPFPL
jgi:hypothetical protein